MARDRGGKGKPEGESRGRGRGERKWGMKGEN